MFFRSSRARFTVWLWLVLVAPALHAADVIWVEDALPPGAVPGGVAEGWTWANNLTQPISGTLSHVSAYASGTHQHYFTGATNTLTIGTGDVLYAYIYLDFMNPPSEVMLQWFDGTWEHRAYWGQNLIGWGQDGTNSRRFVGPLPALAQWVRLQVPASQVGLEGRTINGMAFTLFNGLAQWDRAGKASQTSATPGIVSILAHPVGSNNQNFRMQATGFSVSSAPNAVRVYGTAGYQQIKWNAAQNAIDNLYHGTAVYPDFGTLSNRTDCAHTKDPRLWDARCATDSIGYFWKNISCTTPGIACQTNDRWNASPGSYNLTPLPAVGVWPRTDDFGTTGYATIVDAAKINSVSLLPADTNCSKPSGDTIWVADVLPRAAVPSQLNENWTWVSTSGVSGTAPFAGSLSHQSAIYAGEHQHLFTGSTSPLVVASGESLVTYIYIDPANLPAEVMLQWFDGTTWNHRAYWGQDRLLYGTRFKVSDSLPAAGSWQRLEVRAADVGLAGVSVTGMAFSLFGGRATWDHSGKYTPAAPTGVCPPKTGRPQLSTFHAYNPDEYATGAANSKVVQFKYADGSTRWFMAFNSMIKHVSATYLDAAGAKKNDSSWGRSAADNWRILWATSPDGVSWTVDRQVLIRSSSEAAAPWTGLLMTDMVIDNGYFYVLFQDLVRPNLYLARARVDPTNSPSAPGYVQAEGWSIAATPINNNQYTWKPITPLGGQVNFDTFGAAPVMPGIINPGGGYVKQGSIARIFKSSAAFSQSRVFGITNDGSQVQLWSASDLSQPLEYDTNVLLDPSVTSGGNGWEFSFTHYPDNVAATPRIYAPSFQAWVIESDGGMNYWTMVTRRNLTIAF